MQVFISLFICLISVVFAIGAQAQSSGASTSTSVSDALKSQKPEEKKPPQADQSFQENKEMKLIQVTGSYIKRVDEEGPAPVQTISKEQMKKTGNTSVADVMRDNAITTGGAREDSGSSTPGAATAGIGAFGADSILVLLNGQRLPKIGGENSVDLNLIPMDAVDRVEILKSGASALYGSDAIGGVMNFITKKDMNGGTLSMGQSASQLGGGNKTNFSATFGKSFDRGGILGVVQYKYSQQLADQRREFSKVTNIADEGSPIGGPGTWIDNNGAHADTNCPAENLYTAPNGSTRCMFDYSKYSWNLPEISQTSSLLTGNYKLNDYAKLKTTAVLNYREVRTQFAPPPDRIQVSQAVAQSLGLAATGPVEIQYRLVDVGPRVGQDNTLSYNLAQTLEGKIAGSWTYDITASFGGSNSRTDKRGYADKTVLTSMINNYASNPAQGFNPFAPEGQKGNISGAIFNPFQIITSSQTSVKGVATGQLYEGGKNFGPVAWAVGTSADWQTYKSQVDNITASGNSYGDAGTNGSGQRNYQAVFQEISAFPIDSVEIGAATRFDHYSDFGNAFNPKLSASWQASKKVMLRSSIGTGFRAPNLVDLYNGSTIGYPTVVDQVQCNNPAVQDCSGHQVLVNTSSNRNLTQETSVFATVGFLIQPKRNWNLETNYWSATVNKGVGGIDDGDLTRFESIYGAQALKDRYGIDIVRDGSGNISYINRPSAFNITKSILHGVDFRVSNEAKANIGKLPVNFTTTMNHVQFVGNQKEDFPGLGMKKQRDVYFKNNISVTANHNAHSLTTTARTISGGDKLANQAEIGNGSLPFYTEYDLNYEYAKLFGGTISGGVRNVFNSKRPLDTTVPNPVARLDMRYYDPIGRSFYMNYRYNF